MPELQSSLSEIVSYCGIVGCTFMLVIVQTAGWELGPMPVCFIIPKVGAPDRCATGDSFSAESLHHSEDNLPCGRAAGTNAPYVPDA